MEAARKYGQIIDLAFPQVDSCATAEDIAKLADVYAGYILDYNPAAVMCQGEFTLVYSVIRRLQRQGVLCLAACSERRTIEEKQPDGSVKKTAIFAFSRFREYEVL